MKEIIRRMDINLRISFQKALDVQKTNEQLIEDNRKLRSQLSDMKKSNDVQTTNMQDLKNQMSDIKEQLQFSVTQDQMFKVKESNEEITEELLNSTGVLQSQVAHAVTQLSSTQNHVSHLKKDTDALTTNIADIKTQLSHTQEKLSDTQDQLLNVQKSNEELKISNSILQSKLSFSQNQLTLIQQQLLGIQSMVTFSRAWVISHDQFSIGEEIGRGAWASVHKATFRGGTIAAKCLHDAIISPKTKELFQHEMGIALRCHHQNIVTFLGATMEGAPVILMELMNVNLRKAYEQERVKDHQIHGILHDVAKALHFLHTRPDPVIHRDVSSANVLLKVLYNGEWLAKLGDLGTAKIQQEIATPGPGAMAYGAPEAKVPGEHSVKMDVYSFGVLTLETLTKTHPFQMVDILKIKVRQNYPQYYQTITSCTKQQSSDRPTMYDVLVQLDGIKGST